eukprot:4421927-Pyramimonas_sp.AAC.1
MFHVGATCPPVCASLAPRASAGSAEVSPRCAPCPAVAPRARSWAPRALGGAAGVFAWCPPV